MKIMRGNEVVAVEKIDKNKVLYLEALPDKKFYELPFGLFGYSKRIVTIAELEDWIEDRLFPRSIVNWKCKSKVTDIDKKAHLESVKKTKAIKIGADEFWIDFNN